jgi:hypothetical protein
MNHELVLDLDEWRVTLVTGIDVVVWAHSYGTDGDKTVFNVLMRGKPHYIVPVASFPTAAVAEVRSS